MSYAIDALMLIRLDAHVGEWVDTKTLADHYSLIEHVVADALDSLGRRGLIRVKRERADGPVVGAIVYPRTEAMA